MGVGKDKETGILSETRASTPARRQRHAKAVMGVGKDKETGILSETRASTPARRQRHAKAVMNGQQELRLTPTNTL
jgi:hypothetical protein